MPTQKPTFEVDKQGLRKQLARKGLGFVLLELAQNAFDEEGVTRCEMTLEPIPGTRRYRVAVEDDAPEGFHDLSHAYTLFAESRKKDNPEQRGRFNIGEKLVIAVCDEAKITTTKGTITFDDNGRTHRRESRKTGSIFEGTIPMKKAEYEEACELVMALIPPQHVETTFNGRPIPARAPLRSTEVVLPTQIADEEGYLRKAKRKTTLAVYEPLPGETPTLYEMGIPVVETGDAWHIDIGQKVPLNSDRDNVRPAFLRAVRAEAANLMADSLTPEVAADNWVSEALEDKRIEDKTVETVVTKRFGENRVIFDPSDPEANKIAASKGFTVIPPRAMSKDAWSRVKGLGTTLPAGQVTPSPKVVVAADGVPPIPADKWTDGMKNIAAYVVALGEVLFDKRVSVKFTNDATGNYSAAYGQREMTFNVGRLGYRWFDQIGEAQDRLIVHEFGHELCDDHFSHRYLDALCKIGVKMMRLALEQPGFYAEFGIVPNGNGTPSYLGLVERA